MSTFMGQHPETHGNGTRHGRIGRPKGPGQGIGWIQNTQKRHATGGTNGRRHQGNAQVSERLGRFGFKTILGNDFANINGFGKGIVGHFQRLALQTRQGYTASVLQGLRHGWFLVIDHGRRDGHGRHQVLVDDGRRTAGRRTSHDYIATCRHRRERKGGCRQGGTNGKGQGQGMDLHCNGRGVVERRKEEEWDETVLPIQQEILLQQRFNTQVWPWKNEWTCCSRRKKARAATCDGVVVWFSKSADEGETNWRIIRPTNQVMAKKKHRRNKDVVGRRCGGSFGWGKDTHEG